MFRGWMCQLDEFCGEERTYSAILRPFDVLELLTNLLVRCKQVTFVFIFVSIDSCMMVSETECELLCCTTFLGIRTLS